MVVSEAQMYECHDNFDFVESLCVEKWKLGMDEADVVLVAKHVTEGDVEMALDKDEDWAQIYHLEGQGGRRMCRALLDRRLCVEVVDDAESGRVRKIQRIFIEQEQELEQEQPRLEMD